MACIAQGTKGDQPGRELYGFFFYAIGIVRRSSFNSNNVCPYVQRFNVTVERVDRVATGSWIRVAKGYPIRVSANVGVNVRSQASYAVVKVVVVVVQFPANKRARIPFMIRQGAKVGPNGPHPLGRVG